MKFSPRWPQRHCPGDKYSGSLAADQRLVVIQGKTTAARLAAHQRLVVVKRYSPARLAAYQCLVVIEPDPSLKLMLALHLHCILLLSMIQPSYRYSHRETN